MTAEAAVEPVRVEVVRWRCPFCRRSRSGRGAAREHIARCWFNPGVRSCKTCVNYEPPSCSCWGMSCHCAMDEHCAAGVAIPVPIPDREGRTTLPIHCPLWVLAEDEVAS